jgi:hypothetical protein
MKNLFGKIVLPVLAATVLLFSCDLVNDSSITYAWGKLTITGVPQDVNWLEFGLSPSHITPDIMSGIMFYSDDFPTTTMGKNRPKDGMASIGIINQSNNPDLWGKEAPDLPKDGLYSIALESSPVQLLLYVNDVPFAGGDAEISWQSLMDASPGILRVENLPQLESSAMFYIMENPVVPGFLAADYIAGGILKKSYGIANESTVSLSLVLRTGGGLFCGSGLYSMYIINGSKTFRVNNVSFSNGRAAVSWGDLQEFVL